MPLLVDAAEIAELGDHLAGLVDDVDFVLLIGADPDVALAVDRDAVGRIDAGDQDRGLARGAVGVHRNLDDLVKRGVGDVQDGVVVVELDAVGAERRGEPRARREQRSLDHVVAGPGGTFQMTPLNESDT